MKIKKKILIISLAIVLIFVLGISVFALKSPGIFHCVTVGFSNDFKRFDHNIFISKDTPVNIKDSIMCILYSADKRVCEFWNLKKRMGNPKIIFCNNKELLSKYSPVGIATYKTPLGSYIVFGNDRIDLNMLSHELFHTELFAKIGFIKSNREIPVWFDEGLAMQVDYRKEFSEERYFEMADSIKSLPALSQISTPSTFWSSNFYPHYLIARHEVDTWLKKSGKSNLFRLIDRINNGESFKEIYPLFIKD